MALWTWLEICTPYMSQVTPQAKAPKKARQISLHILHTHTHLIHHVHIPSVSIQLITMPSCPRASFCCAGASMRDARSALASFGREA